MCMMCSLCVLSMESMSVFGVCMVLMMNLCCSSSVWVVSFFVWVLFNVVCRVLVVGCGIEIEFDKCVFMRVLSVMSVIWLKIEVWF